MKKLKQKLDYLILWLFIRYVIISQMGADAINQKINTIKTKHS